MKYLYFLSALLLFLLSIITAFYVNKTFGFPLGLPISFVGGLVAGNIFARGMFL